MKNKLLLIIAIAVVAIGGYMVFSSFGNDSASDIPSDDVKQLVAEYSANTKTNLAASITSNELILIEKNGKKQTFDLPKDEFFVSIAPFYEQTHPCEIHSLTGCRGELAKEEFHVYIEDKDGNIIVNEKMTSLDNGFIDLWLPRDNTFFAKIEKDGKISELTFSTFAGDKTCITTMQLL
ncbi:CueP family metal-binding protein [Bacillus kwashiorkori]|uniref:CueP family metal-binding protein n=1 Tax=Bacillus kwashiorkori TaxID=1522318 RepID=UPI0007817088|nr:CueP family metal-binding protein [Bacillus kwashiorkori]